MSDWDVDGYLKFESQRNRPIEDLISRIPIQKPEMILDMGCGPGNSTKILQKHFPEARIKGIDRSETMLERARQELPNLEWILADISEFHPHLECDIIFSNATLQWIPDVEQILQMWFSLLSPGGVIAVQVPENRNAPIVKAMAKVHELDSWNKYQPISLPSYRPAFHYYEILAPFASEIDLWETTYFHRLGSLQEMIDWYRVTGMKPYLEGLPDSKARLQFETEVLNECRSSYRQSQDGFFLFPFQRTFFVAKK